ncbi:MAG TPA: ATP-binding protein [Synergistaceae bacterium]|nr:ATP-binding protein [Synergistaceae bacterium]HPJ25045.1 ATP-binding protein [Synergistaceae bacterium]HPQ36669.1 ATP-binding protein [Synergistaceae bacterium]
MVAWHEVRALQVKLDTLLRERDEVNRVLEAAVNTGSFFAELDRAAEPGEVLKRASRMVRSFVPFRHLSFYLLGEDGLSFECAYSDSEDARRWIQGELDFLIEDGTVAWALGRNKPVMVTARDGESHVMLHALVTPNRVMGLFVGVLQSSPEIIMDVAITFLTVVLGSTASVLLNADLYREVTHLNRELEEKVRYLQESERAADAANRAKDIFLANVSHEVRTPLNGILGIGELLLRTDMNSRQREMASTLIQEGRVLLHLINDILDISKIDSGAFHLEKIPFSLQHLLEGVYSAFLERIREKGLDFRKDFSWNGIPPLLLGDPLRIRQIAANLISNAVKFTSRGEILFGCRAEGYREGAYVLSFYVRDTGRGMSQEEQARLFNTFSQGDPSISRTYGGTGLGLFISRRLAEMMAGSVILESSPGEGSCFTVRIVLHRAPEGAREEKMQPLEDSYLLFEGDPLEPPSFSGKTPSEVSPRRFLVVDDNRTNLKVLSGLLENLGYTAVGVSRGEDALELLRKEKFQAVFTDIRMEGMDGIALKKTLQSPDFPGPNNNIPLVAVTANAMRGDRQRYLDEGFHAYLPKPVSTGQLRELVQTLFSSDTQGEAEDLSIFDRKRLLSRLEGDEDLCRAALEEFCRSAEESLESLRKLWKDGGEKVGFCAHKIRGGAENVNASRIALRAARLEKAEAQGKNREYVERLVDSLEREILVFLDYVKSL